MKCLPICMASVLIALPLAGCRRGHSTSVVGSTSVQPFAEMLAEAFHETHPDVKVEVQGGGSTAGLQALANGIADIASCSRSLTAEEAKSARPITIARDGIAIVVSNDNPVHELTTRQIQRIFAGDVTNWKDVGGKDGPIRIITREEGSGTRESFTHLVMGKTAISRKALTQESNGAVRELVGHDVGAIGYISLGLVEGLKVLKVDGVVPSHDSVSDGSYKLARPFLFVVKGEISSEAQQFVDFALSPQGQSILEKEGLVRVAK